MRIALLPLLALAGPAAAQMHHMDGMQMPGMTMPMKPVAKPKPKPKPKPPARSATKPKATPAAAACAPEHAAMGHCTAPAASEPEAPATPPPAAACAPEHAAMGHCTAPTAAPAAPPPAATCAPEHAAMGHCTPAAAPTAAGATGTDQPAGDAPAPAPPTDLAAARFYDPAAMAMANRMMRDEHGGMRFAQILFNLAEVQVRNGRDGYRWDGEGWFGGDIHRLVVKSEGEGTLRGRLGNAEVQALYSRALDPYWNVQAGLRQDWGAGAKRTFATVGIEGLAPYWFDVEGALFVSDKGVRARAEAWYDQRITQRAILQPRIELNLSAQDEPDVRIGAGLSDAEIGLRLRYEIAREFAPYVGIGWERRYGATARYARADGDDSGGVALALGLRGWF